MTQKHFVIATAGHVDHGKSSLVKALTGTDPDRLPEEKARQITIDLGFAELNLRGPGGEEIHAAIVDVPGHEDFVRNMIAGVGSIDLALFVVAADDGWMPQTEEHLQILEYLGVTRAVVALTKIDIGDPARVEAEIREHLRETAFTNAPLVQTSARPPNLTALSSQVSEGVAELKRALASELSQTQPQRDVGKPRLFVDRAFTLRGVGTVVTGTLAGGALRVGDPVCVQPRGRSARLRSLQSHGRDVDLALPGTRTAINLPDLKIDIDIQRGDVVTVTGFEPVQSVDVCIQRSARSAKAAAIKSRSSIYFHHGTRRLRAKVVLLESESLRAGSHGIARLELSEPALVFVGDDFVLRDGSERHTLGGGKILGLNGDYNVSLLRKRAAAPRDVDVFVETELERQRVCSARDLLLHSRFSAAEIGDALARLQKRGEVAHVGDIAANAAAWHDLRDRAGALVDAAHRQHPERRGLEVREVRALLDDQRADVIDALIGDLCRNGFVRDGSIIARSQHRAALPPRLSAIAQSIRERVAANLFDPPSRQQLAPDTTAQEAIRFLLQQNELVQISDDVVVSGIALEQMRDVIADFISKHGPATVSQLREALGSSRRVMVPVLERLDREGFTCRVGDKRALASKIASDKLSDAATARSN